MYTYYAIREKATGNFLPQSDRTVGSGFTKFEPRKPEAVPPRLFTSIGAARCALTWWLKGHHKQNTDTDEDYFGHSYTYTIGPTGPVPGTARDPNSMEIVSINLNNWVSHDHVQQAQ